MSRRDVGSSRALGNKSIKTVNPPLYGSGRCLHFRGETLTDVLGQHGELVNVLARVLAAGHAEAKLEIEAL